VTDSTTKPVRVVLAEDHRLVREGLRALLEAQDGFAVVGEAVDGHEAVAIVERLQPDLVLLDVSMPGYGGLDALRDLADRPHGAKILLVTASIDREDIAVALQLGARGIVLKEAASEALLSAIKTVLSGGLWLGDAAVSELVTPSGARPRPAAGRSAFGLTPREREILESITAGLSNREIASTLSLSEQTVKHHLSSIFDKTGTSSRLELALFAVRNGLAST
jgi:two-component system, NarL family, nitrate/nitrite response regulator NarL